jgi:hypothetical protein
MVGVLFRRPLPEPCWSVSRHTALQWSIPGGCACPTGVGVLVAGAADHEGLAAPLGHEVHPRGSVGPTGAVEIGELAEVVDFQAGP